MDFDILKNSDKSNKDGVIYTIIIINYTISEWGWVWDIRIRDSSC